MKKRLTFLIVAMVALVFGQTGTISAISPNQQQLYLQGITYFDTCTDAGGACCSSSDNGSAVSTSASLTVSGPYQWTSNAQQPYYIEELDINILEDLAQALKLPTSSTVTQQHVMAMVAWAMQEGGNQGNSNAFNLMNMGFLSAYPQLYVGGGGAADGSSDSFVSFDAAVEAYTIEITSSAQNRIGQVLSDPTSSAEDVLTTIANYGAYTGDQEWAASTTYEEHLLEMLHQTENDYDSEASIIIGPGQEGKSQHVPTSELQYHSGNSSGDGTTATEASSPSECSGGSSLTSANCNGQNLAGDALILCDAEQYNGIYYQSGGGHQGYSAFRSDCPLDSISAAASSSTGSAPGPCATDCSGLVSVSIDQAFNLDYTWTVSVGGVMTGDGAQYWQKIPISSAQPGDILTRQGGEGHVEIVESINNNSITTFGSHMTGVKTSAVSSTASYWTYAYHWTGPGSGGSS